MYICIYLYVHEKLTIHACCKGGRLPGVLGHWWFTHTHTQHMNVGPHIHIRVPDCNWQSLCRLEAVQSDCHQTRMILPMQVRPLRDVCVDGRIPRWRFKTYMLRIYMVEYALCDLILPWCVWTIRFDFDMCKRMLKIYRVEYSLCDLILPWCVWTVGFDVDVLRRMLKM